MSGLELLDLGIGTVALVASVGALSFQSAMFRRLREHGYGSASRVTACVGYEQKNVYDKFEQVKDCEARAAVDCADGRCSHHCRAMCKCTTPERAL